VINDYEFQGAVAFLDILGFGARTARVALSEARDTVVGPLLKAVMDAQTIVLRDLLRIPHSPRLEFHYFADSLVLYLPCVPGTVLSTPSRVLDSMVYSCSLVLASGIWLNLPLRGAIAYGDCLVCRDPMYFIGQPFLEAHRLERSQNWAGAALCESAATHLRDDECVRVVEWPVPLKTGHVSMLAVNWPRQSIGPFLREIGTDGQVWPGPTPNWDSCFPVGAEESVAVKRKNTEEFFAAQNPLGPLGPAFGPEQRDLVKYWKEMYFSSRLSSE